MQQSEILSLAESLIPAYGDPDLDMMLEQLTQGEASSVKVLVKMELHRLMTSCTKSVDLRGRVQGECKEYQLHGIIHWLDDVAINIYHEKVKYYGGYTEAVYDAISNTRNNFRIMQPPQPSPIHTDPKSRFFVEAIKLGLNLNRQEQRLKMSTEVEVKLPGGQKIHAVSVNLSNSGVKLKVPGAFDYHPGEVIQADFTELRKLSGLQELELPIDFRIIGIEENNENKNICRLRALRLTNTKILGQAINTVLNHSDKALHLDNKDKILQARIRGYEYTHIKYTPHLALLFSDKALEFTLLNDYNKTSWNYWHDERNQQSLSSLFNASRIKTLTQSGHKQSCNTIYAFIHDHQGKKLHYSLIPAEAKPEERQLFWHIGSKRKSWKVFRIHMFELNQDEKENFIAASFGAETSLGSEKNEITHLGVLQEIADFESGEDYQLTEKPHLNSSILDKFRHSRRIIGHPRGIYYDVSSHRKEERFIFRSPLELSINGQQVITGQTLNFSPRGLRVSLSQPLSCKRGDLVKVTLQELQRYDESAQLTNVTYTVVRVAPNGLILHLAIKENHQINRTILFLKKLINYNKNKLQATDNTLPGIEFLHTIYDVLLPRLVSAPIYISKQNQLLQPIAIGVNYPLASYLKLFRKLGDQGRFSLNPVFKSRSGRLLKDPIRPVPDATPIYHLLYISIIKSGDKFEAIVSKLHNEFASQQERVRFIKRSKQLGEFYALRVSGLPAIDISTQALIEALRGLAVSDSHHIRLMEKEFKSIVGYGEIIDISDEVLTRVELI